MMFLLPKTYQECPEGDSFEAPFESLADAPFGGEQGSRSKVATSGKPPRSSSSTASTIIASATSISTTNSNTNTRTVKVKQKKKERHGGLLFFHSRRSNRANRAGAFPLLADTKNQQPTPFDTAVLTPVKSRKPLSTTTTMSQVLYFKPDPQGLTPPGKVAAADAEQMPEDVRDDQENVSAAWSANFDTSVTTNDNVVKDAPNAPATTTAAITTAPVATAETIDPYQLTNALEDYCEQQQATSLSISFPDFAEFIRGMEQNNSSVAASANLTEVVMNTSGLSFAVPDEEEQEEDGQQVVGIVAAAAAEFTQISSNSLAADTQQHLQETEPSIDKLEQLETLDLLVAAAAAGEDKSVTVDNQVKSLQQDEEPVAAVSPNLKEQVKDLQQQDEKVRDPAASPDLKKQLHNTVDVPALTPDSIAQSTVQSGSGDNHYNDETVQVANAAGNMETSTEDDNALVDEAWNSVNVSILSISGIFEDELEEENNAAPLLSSIAGVLNLAEKDTSKEMERKLYSSQDSSFSTASEHRQDRSMFGDWAAEVMSIEVSLEAGKLETDDSCIAHFVTRSEYMPRFQSTHEEQEPVDETTSDLGKGSYYVKAEWNEFMPASQWASSCNSGEGFSLDVCGNKNWIVRR